MTFFKSGNADFAPEFFTEFLTNCQNILGHRLTNLQREVSSLHSTIDFFGGVEYRLTYK